MLHLQQPIIILLSGWSQSGKDTAADFLVTRYGFQKFALADEPKLVISEKYNFPLEWTMTQEGKTQEIWTEKGMRQVRDVIIEYANGERIKNPRIWSEIIAQKINRCSNICKKFVISDWRFIDELIGLQKALHGISPIIYPIQIRRPSQLVSPVSDNTEYALLGFPFYMTIQNPGDKYFYMNIVRELHSTKCLE